MEVLEQPADLLRRFANGDVDAFESLFREFQGEVYAWIVRIVRDPATAEDLTVETFWRIHRAHARFDPNRSFGAWARRIATNVALDYLKSPRTRWERPADEEAIAQIPDRSHSNPGERQEIRMRVQRAFEQLPPRLRMVATLALIEEKSHAEIADALNVSTGAVKSRVFRAVQLLRRKLQNLGGNHE